MTDILKIENLLKVLTDVATWAEDLQNNMDRLREDLDEFCKSQKDSDRSDDSNGSSGSDSNRLYKNNKSNLDKSSDESDDSESESVDQNIDLIDLNGSKSLRRHNPHSNDLTIIIDLENPEASLVYDGTDFKKITDKVIDLEDEVVMYRNKIVYSVVKNRLVDMSESWDKACLDRESRILIESKRYQDLMKKKQFYQEMSLV